MSRTETVNHLTLSGALAALTTCILWGGNVVALKIGLQTFAPFWSAFWRILAGIVVVALWGWSQGSLSHRLGANGVCWLGWDYCSSYRFRR